MGRNQFRRKVERVYFVGAGFSKALGYPLGNELIAEIVFYLRRLMRNPEEGSKLRNDQTRKKARLTLLSLNAFLDEYFFFRCNLIRAGRKDVAAALRGVNLLSFFNLIQTLTDSGLDLRRQRRAAAGARMPLNELYDALKAAIRSRMTEIYAENRSVTPDIGALFASIRPDRDAIISFNWDTEIEGHLWWRYHRRVGGESTSYTLDDWLRFPRRTCVLVLKPHGSITWYPVTSGVFSQIDPVAWDDQRLAPGERRLVSHYYEEWLPEDREDHEVLKLDVPPAIAPPTFAKRFELPEQKLIWTDLVRVCRSAREFIFLGYRVPDDDFLTAAAMCSALRGPGRKKCVVVNRSWEGLENAFAPAFGAGGVSEERNFLSWTFGKRQGETAPALRDFVRELNRKLQDAYVVRS